MRRSVELLIEYQRLWNSCVVRPERAAEVAARVRRIAENQAKYEAVSAALGVGRDPEDCIPWEWIGVLHSLESDCDFRTHLHNGDSLRRRTVHVPKGRPRTGEPPFTWQASAEDALAMKGLHQVEAWTIPVMLYYAEAYNGWGYRQRKNCPTLSPYLWAGTNHYTRGKYVADGRFSATAVSKQIGAAALLQRFFQEAPTNDGKKNG